MDQRCDGHEASADGFMRIVGVDLVCSRNTDEQPYEDEHALRRGESWTDVGHRFNAVDQQTHAVANSGHPNNWHMLNAFQEMIQNEVLFGCLGCDRNEGDSRFTADPVDLGLEEAVGELARQSGRRTAHNSLDEGHQESGHERSVNGPDQTQDRHHVVDRHRSVVDLDQAFNRFDDQGREGGCPGFGNLGEGRESGPESRSGLEVCSGPRAQERDR